MGTLWLILTQFIFRLSFGLAVAMAITPPRLVTSGFYRVHLWVVMGMSTFAGLAVYSSEDQDFPNRDSVLALCIAAVACSFIGAVIWLYERSTAGRVALLLVALIALSAAHLASPLPHPSSGIEPVVLALDLVTGGLVLGVTMAAMFLGHWYLNTPTMQLLPLQRLVQLLAISIVVRAALCALGLVLTIQANGSPDTSVWAFIALRWLAGLVGALALTWMTWLTLRVPNTQSATGILYAAVILVFIGELTSKLLSDGGPFPL